MSHKQIPTVASEERIQASYPGDTALSTSSVDYEFHPDVQPEQYRLRKGACSTTPNYLCALQGRNFNEGLYGDYQDEDSGGQVKVAVLGDNPGVEYGNASIFISSWYILLMQWSSRGCTYCVTL